MNTEQYLVVICFSKLLTNITALFTNNTFLMSSSKPDLLTTLVLTDEKNNFLMHVFEAQDIRTMIRVVQ